MSLSRELSQEIPLNPLDRYYVTPRKHSNPTDYYPMSLACMVVVKRSFSAAEIRAAIAQVDAKIPQFRLRYRLDPQRECWVKVCDNELQQHFDSLVAESAWSDDDVMFAQTLAGNIQPFTQGVRFIVSNRRWLVHMHHGLHGGSTLNDLIAALICELVGNSACAVQATPSAPIESPLWRVVWSTPKDGLQSWFRWLTSIFERARDLKKLYSIPQVAKIAAEAPDARIVTRVQHRMLPTSSLNLLERLRAAVSSTRHIELKVLLQVMIARYLIELGVQPQPPEYTFVIDLRRYIAPSTLFGGNLSSILSIKGATAFDFAAECDQLQQQLQTRLRARSVLTPILNQWLISLIRPRLRHKLSQRQWSQPPTISSAYFELNYYGKVQSFDNVNAYWADDAKFISGSSLENTIPLILHYAVIENKGYLTAVYNNLLVADDIVHSLCDLLAKETVLSAWISRYVSLGL